MYLVVIKKHGTGCLCQAKICFATDNLKLICEINFWLAAPNVDPGTAVSSLKSERGEAEKRERPTKFLSF